MRRLAALSLGVVAIFALMMGATLLMGHMQPPSERVERMHLTDCTPPCWNDITPRMSSRGDVETRVSSTFPDFKPLGSGNLPFLSWVQADLTIDDRSINVALDGGLIYSIGIGSPLASDQMPSLGEVLAVFGAPTCAVIDPTSRGATFSYENAAHQVILQVSVAQPSWFSPVMSMSVGVSNQAVCEKAAVLSWPEFRHAQHSFS